MNKAHGGLKETAAAAAKHVCAVLYPVGLRMTGDRTTSNNEARRPPDNSSMEERNRIIEIWRRADVTLHLVAKGD